MKRRILLWALVLLCSWRVGAAPRNVLLIIADDIGIDSLHLYNDDPAASFPPIPNIQSLAEQGILFENAYAYPTCSPTRSSIMTGRYGFRTGVLSPQSSDLPASETTLPEIFAQQAELDQPIASFGKWHLGGGNSGPNVLGGWPHFSGAIGGGLRNFRNWEKVINGVSTNVTMTYATRDNVNDALDWMDAQGTNNWLMWIGFNAAHTPLHKPPNGLHSYTLSGDSADVEANPRPYFEAMVEAMDTQIGLLLASVDFNETTVVFLGDNGTARSVIQPPYDIPRRAKGSLYEGGTHVPMIVAGDAVVNGGRTSDAVVHCVDLFATMIELAGGTAPEGVDSRSLVSILQNQTFTPAETAIFLGSDNLNVGSTGVGRAIIDPPYKLIRVEGLADEFYHLENDPLESSNLLLSSLSSGEQQAYDALSAKLESATNAVAAVVIPTNGYPIVDTGQLDYYDDQGGYTITAPGFGEPFAGQDAAYAGRQPAYRDNGDGTVTDLNTGLMWQQSPDLVNKSSFSNALTGAAAFSLAGYTDWRLPTVKELYSLINFSGNTGSSELDAIPYINTNYSDFAYGDSATERYIDAQYWTATEYVGTTMAGDETVFGVNFADGLIKGYPKFRRSGGDNTAFVRYVRGNPTYGINGFSDLGNGTVMDQATGLMWQKADSSGALNWEEALAYAENLELAGYRDWRLPNAKELHSLVDYSRAPLITGTAAIDTNYFEVSETESFYWTSTTHLDGAPLTRGNYAVYHSFGQAYGWMPDSPSQTDTYVLYDVHGAGAQRSDPKSGTPVLIAPGHGPQGDILRIYNYVRCVRGGASAPETDSDGDGLTDAFEWNYAGDILAMSATFDDDLDGASNLEGQIAGTIPIRVTSVFQITGLSVSNRTEVSWSSELDRSYRISSTTNLVETAFSVIDSSLVATPPTNAYVDERALPVQRFYRIEVE